MCDASPYPQNIDIFNDVSYMNIVHDFKKMKLKNYEPLTSTHVHVNGYIGDLMQCWTHLVHGTIYAIQSRNLLLVMII